MGFGECGFTLRADRRGLRNASDGLFTLATVEGLPE